MYIHAVLNMMLRNISIQNRRFLPSISIYTTRNTKLCVPICTSCISNRNSSSSLLQQNADDRLLVSRISFSKLQSREKSSSKKEKKNEYHSDSDSDDEEFLQKEREKTKGVKVVQIQVDNLRADVITKHAFNISRNKYEVLFYEGRIRVNGRKIAKKSYNTDISDEVDIIKEVSPENPAFLNVSRVEILKARPSGDYILLTVRKQKGLLIENYEEDPWLEKETTSETSDDNEKEK